MKKVLIAFLFAMQLALNNQVFAQESSNIYEVVPKEYDAVFKDDQKKYLEYTNPLAESVGMAYKFWRNAIQRHWTDYNFDSLFAVYNLLRDKEYVKKIEFITQHPDSYASIYYFNLSLLNATRINKDSLLSIFFLLSENLQATPLGRSIYASIRRKQSLSLGSEMPVFTFKTNNGQLFKLDGFRDQKHVLICFWASWCGPCVRNIPLLKKIEELYRYKGLQVVSVSIDDNPKSWLRAVEKYAMHWLQTCDVQTYIDASKVRSLYEIHVIPQYFLIDKQGKLIYQSVLSNDSEDYSSLQQVLHKVLN